MDAVDTFYAEFDFVSVETALKAVWASDGSGKMDNEHGTRLPGAEFVQFLPPELVFTDPENNEFLKAIQAGVLNSLVHPPVECTLKIEPGAPIPHPGYQFKTGMWQLQYGPETKEQQARRLFRSEE